MADVLLPDVPEVTRPPKPSGCRAAVAASPLTRELVFAGLSCLGPTSDGLGLALLRADVSNARLTDINVLSSYPALQEISLRNNCLTTLDPLSSLPHLVKLDASGNALSAPGALACLSPTLLELRLSKNAFLAVPKMSHLRYLRELYLDFNQLTTLAGVDHLPELTLLSVTHNQLRSVDALAHASTCLKTLHLDHNHVADLQPLQRLHACLHEVTLAHNDVAHLDVLSEFALLLRLDLRGNAVEDASEVALLQAVTSLCDLSLEDNPLWEVPPPEPGRNECLRQDVVLPDSGDVPLVSSGVDGSSDALPVTTAQYQAGLRAALLAQLPQLQRLNGVEISSEEKVKAACKQQQQSSTLSSTNTSSHA